MTCCGREYDLPARMAPFGTRRGLTLDGNNQMLRATSGMESLCRRFRLGVNFVGTVVNRHRIEAYILDDRGRIACSVERLQ